LTSRRVGLILQIGQSAAPRYFTMAPVHRGHCLLQGRRVAQPLIWLTPKTRRVPRPLRTLQRAGTTNACAAGFCAEPEGCVGSIATRPCKQRKEGAPTVLVMAAGSKAGPPASPVCPGFSVYAFLA
jgi:hypothetical protein